MIACSVSLITAWLAQDQAPNFTVAFADGGPATIVRFLWLIPAIPMLAAGLIALLKQPQRKLAAALAIGGLAISFVLALFAFAHVLSAWSNGTAMREIVSFNWFDLGATHLQL